MSTKLYRLDDAKRVQVARTFLNYDVTVVDRIGRVSDETRGRSGGGPVTTRAPLPDGAPDASCPGCGADTENLIAGSRCSAGCGWWELW